MTARHRETHGRTWTDHCGYPPPPPPPFPRPPALAELVELVELADDLARALLPKLRR